MTVEHIEHEIQFLIKLSHDDEAAHGFEDQLRSEVLGAIASGTLTADECVAVAKAVLKTSDVKFSRWCA